MESEQQPAEPAAAMTPPAELSRIPTTNTAVLGSGAAAVVSRRRREIARIIEEEQERIVQCAVNHNGVASQRMAMRRWKYGIGGRARLIHIARQGALSLLHRNMRKGCNGWTNFILERVAALTQLRAAAQGFRNRGLKKAMNLLIAQQQERKAKLASLRRAMSSWVNAALRRGWRKLVVLGALRRKAKQAARSFLFRNRRKGWNGWIAMVVEKARKMMLLRSAASSFANRALRKGMNGWVAMRNERLKALARMEHAALCFAQRAIRSGFRAWLPLIGQRQSMKRAAAAFTNRGILKGFNGWVGYLIARAAMLHKMRSSAMALSQGAYHACWYTWKQGVLEYNENLAKLRAAANVLMGGKLRAAFNSLANRKEAFADEFARFEKAGKMFAAGAVGTGFKAWQAYAAAQKLLPPGGPPRPISPNAKRRVRWARKVSEHAPKRELTADDKYACQRSLLSPYAALVLRFDGAVLRVVNVHRPPSEHLCTVDLTRGFDELMLAESPADARAENVLAAAPRGGVRISAGALSAPHHMLVVPCFFGGVLRLRNDLEVRVIDARFDDSRAPPDPDDDLDTFVPEKVLTHVLLTLVDGAGEAVGRASWTELLQLLEMLPTDYAYVCESMSEDALRKKRRLELHRSEQRRLALHHLRLASRRGEVPTAWGEGGGNTQLGGGSTTDFSASPRGASPGGGIDGLLRQIEDAAPSRLLGGDPLSDAPSSRKRMVGSSSAKAFSAGFDQGRRPVSAHFR